MELNSEKITREMHRAGMSMAKLGGKIGMSRQAISYILKTKSTNLKTITKIAQALSLDGKDLLT